MNYFICALIRVLHLVLFDVTDIGRTITTESNDDMLIIFLLQKTTVCIQFNLGFGNCVTKLTIGYFILAE